MSDDKKKDKDKDKRTNEDDKSTPGPINGEVTAWFERLFRGDEQPTVVFSTRLEGRRFNQPGDVIKRYPFRPGDKPSREEIVRVSNEFMMVMQEEADTLSQARVYRLEAQNAVKGGNFDSWPVRCEPRGRRGALVRAEDAEGEDGLDDATGGDVLRKRVEGALADVRFHTEVNMQATAGVLHAVLDLLKDFRDEQRELRADYRTLSKQLNAAENDKVYRDMLLEKERFKLRAQERGLNMLAAVLPDWLGKIANGGDKVNPDSQMTGGTEEKSVTANDAVRRVLSALSEEEQVAIFGRWDGDRLRDKDKGVLTEAQVRIIAAVVNQGAPDETLDQLIRGPHRITDSQYLAVSQAIDLNKLAPLVYFLQQRQKKLGSEAPPPAPKTDN